MKKIGIALFIAIVGGCAVYYITNLWPVKESATETSLQGMVYNADAPVAKAMVYLILVGSGTNETYHNVTDENGSYRFDNLPSKVSASVRAEAGGYRASSVQSLPSPLQHNVRIDIALTPLPSPGTIPQEKPKTQIEHKPVFVPKAVDQATRIIRKP
jgi:hypothetical protein